MAFNISKNVRYNDVVGWRKEKLVKLNRNYAGRFYSKIKPIGIRYAKTTISGLTMEGKPFSVILPERIQFSVK